METVLNVILIIALILSLVLPFQYYCKGIPSKKRFQISLAGNIVLFFGIVLVASIGQFGQVAFATSTDIRPIAAELTASSGNGLAYLSAALSTGLSCIGGGLAVAAAASAALGAISEDSSVLGKSLIFIGLAEGVCLYGLIISFMILGKI
ncbi:hypothetical protein FACS189418_3130 [Clostridia bacterium]|nr:hypothetical protein FACS189418_3130 [Clostridia bacterium]